MTDKRSESQFNEPVSPSKMSDAEAEQLLNTKYKGLKGIDMDKVSSVSMPSRGDTRPGTGKWDFGGGRVQVNTRSEEDMGERDMTKFDKNNKYHVAMLSTNDETTQGRMLHPGGYFSFPKKSKPGAPAEAPKAAPKKRAAAPAKPVDDKAAAERKAAMELSAKLTSDRDKAKADAKAAKLKGTTRK